MISIDIARELTAQQCKSLLLAQLSGETLNTVDFCPEENVRNVLTDDGTQKQFVTADRAGIYPPAYITIETDNFLIQAGLSYNTSASDYTSLNYNSSGYVIDKSTNNIIYYFNPSKINNESGESIGANYVWSITKWTGNKIIIVYTTTANSVYSLKAVIATITDSGIVASDTSYAIATTSSTSYRIYSVWVANLAPGKLFLVWNQVYNTSSSTYVMWQAGLKVNDNGTIKCGTATQINTAGSTLSDTTATVFDLITINENTALLSGHFSNTTNNTAPWKLYRVTQTNYSATLTVLFEGSTCTAIQNEYPYMNRGFVRYQCSYCLGNYTVFKGYQGYWYKIPSNTTDFTDAQGLSLSVNLNRSSCHQIVGSKLIVYDRESSSWNTTVGYYDADTNEEHYGTSLLKFESSISTGYTDLMIFNWDETPLMRVRDRDDVNYDLSDQPYYTFIPFHVVDGVISCIDYNVDTPIVTGESNKTKIITDLRVTVNTWCSNRKLSIRFNGNEILSTRVSESVIIPVNIVVGETDVLSVCLTTGFGNVKISAMGGVMEETA